MTPAALTHFQIPRGEEKACLYCAAALMCIAGVAEHYQRENNTLVIFTTPDDVRRSVFHEHPCAQILISGICPALRAKLTRMRSVYNAEEMEQVGALWRREYTVEVK